MSATIERRWTRAQRDAITATGQSLLVSAAAGSGKTAVLAERCVHLICDAKDACGIDELLVVTFTRAAAAEMRGRIEQALRARLAKKRDRELSRQLALIDRAEIGTLHSFCGKIIRRHFDLLGIDPSFVQLDERDALLMRIEVARQLFEKCYAEDQFGDFQRFLGQYAGGREDALRASVLRTYELMMSTVDPAAWAALALERLTSAAESPLSESALGNELLALIADELDGTTQQLQTIRPRVVQLCPAYEPTIDQLIESVQMMRGELNRGYSHFTKAATLFRDSKPRLPGGRAKDQAEKACREAAKQLLDSVREPFDNSIIFVAERFAQSQWQDGLRHALPAAKQLLELVQRFSVEYAAAKLAIRAVDFADLERLALQVLRDPDRPGLHPSAAARVYQEQFQHVLVDEYQDINALQDAILKLVSREKPGEIVGFTPNLFCVGDVKQSIYRFRLADPRRFLERDKALRPSGNPLGRVIDLSENFRSAPPVLNAINAVFCRLMSGSSMEIEYDASHELRPGHEPEKYSLKHAAAVELHVLDKPPEPQAGARGVEFNSIEREAAVAARLIRELVDDPKLAVKYGDVAVLLRAMRFKSEQFAAMLRTQGIPVHTTSAGGFFEATEIRDMLSLLRLLDNPLQDIPLAAVLRSPLADLPRPEDSLARIRLTYRDARPRIPFHRAVFRYADTRTDELATRLRHFADQLNRWRDAAHSRPLHDVLMEILNQTAYMSFCAGLLDGPQRSANLLQLHTLARQFGSFQKQGLRRFLDYLSMLEGESDLGEAALITNPGNVVRVMSIHRSKGLQFPVVVVPDLAKSFNLNDLREQLMVDRDLGIAPQVVDLPRRVRYPSLASVVTKHLIRRKTAAEELRVLYVAMTRAEEKLILIGSPRGGPQVVDQWRAHATGDPKLSSHVALGAGAPLDWIGPAYASIERSDPELIKLVTHDEPAVEKLLERSRRRVEKPDINPKVAALAPLTETPDSPLGRRVIDELSWQRPLREYENVPAAMAITALTKSGRLAAAGASPSLRKIVKFNRPLPKPRFATDQVQLAPTAIGAATHLVMQLIDLATLPTPAAVEAAVGSLVDRKFISAAEAKVVDVEAIVWFLGTPLGIQLREHRNGVQRELPVFAPAAADPALPKSDDPRDRVMLRGQIDALLRLPEGLVVIDYKTDRVTPATLPERAAFYREQIGAYAGVIAAVTGLPVIASHLVFLHARQIVDL